MILLWAAALVIAKPALAMPVRLDLKSAIDYAILNNKELAGERAVVDQADADIDRVGGEFGPHVEAIVGAGPIYRATGNALESSSDKSVWGRSILGNVSYTQPLFSFGRRSSYERAAFGGKRVKEAGVLLKAGEVRLQVKEAYYGYLGAKSLLDFIEEGKADLDKAIKDRNKLSRKDSYRLDLFLFQIDSKKAELTKALRLAEEALQLRVGANEGEAFLPKEDWLDTFEQKLESLDFYTKMAEGERQEFSQLRDGISAKMDLARAERQAFLPVMALLARYEFTDTNVRPEQHSVFAYDPYNRDSFAVGLGFKWDLQWGLPQAKAAKFTAEAEELEAKQAFASRGILTEVKRAYWEVEEANARLTAATSANRTTKKWLSGQIMALGSGLGNGKLEELPEAYGARAEAVRGYYEAILEQHMAWARLSRAVGQELDPSLR